MGRSKRGIAGIVALTLLIASAPTRADEGEMGAIGLAEISSDERDDFGATFFIGSAIDNFAANDLKRYLNPDASGDPGVFERAIGGVQFSYRLFASEGDTPGDEAPGRSQVWVYGLTVHGVRSSDVDCAADPDIKVCRGFEEETDPAGRYLYIVRNASSLEAAVGVRWEFARLRENSSSPSAAYVNAQAGFLTVAGIGEDIVDQHHIGIGVTSIGGKYRESYLELGYGRSDLFVVQPTGRWKVNALMSWWPDGWHDKVSAFARILVDADLGDGADSIQSYFGLRFDLAQLFARTDS